MCSFFYKVKKRQRTQSEKRNGVKSHRAQSKKAKERVLYLEKCS
jgi:hypothetical protein